jgi:hypothetical protein
MTHYCRAGNQPRLVAQGHAGDTIRFDFVEATNLAPADGHIQAATFRPVPLSATTDPFVGPKVKPNAKDS